ncbi:hypothetical protein [Bacillus sp. FJAT-42315]|uniref:hypothetical protein n=1 Tax=Bacillus sp. FJAT-42315 TaxID=2014077 RepID=UPI000C24A7EB|nr:hypothetical protein [Bacillus sp. FJAT-42315]
MMRLSEFVYNPYIMCVIMACLFTVFLAVFYVSWTLMGVAFIGGGCFFLYIIAIYRLVLYQGVPRHGKKEDHLFMSLWYAWPLYVLSTIVVFFFFSELAAIFYAAGGSFGILVSEWLQVKKTEERVAERKVKMKAQ